MFCFIKSLQQHFDETGINTVSHMYDTSKFNKINLPRRVVTLKRENREENDMLCE